MTALRMMDGQCTVSAVGGPGEHENTQILKYKYVDTPHSRGSDRSIAPGRSESAIGCALFSAQVLAQSGQRCRQQRWFPYEEGGASG